MTTKNTLHALITSILALTLCLSMLIGTTYAWFTDSVTTGVNTIQSGTLDVDMVDESGASLAGRTLAFRNAEKSEDILWEPGAKFALDTFYVVNKGNLALKYQIFINGLSGNAKLLDVITFTVKIGDAEIPLAEFNTRFTEPSVNHLAPSGDPDGKDKSAAIIIYGEMAENAGNEYQDQILDGISITVYATQYTAESDSFDNQYDAAATYLNQDENGNWLISNAAELLYFAKSVNGGKNYKGETVKLTADIDLANVVWIPISGFGGTFDGNGYTISNFSLASATSASFFASIHSTATIQNVVFDNASVSGTHYVAVVLGWEGNETVNATITNVKVTNSKVVCDTNPTPDNGDKAGFIVGYAVTLNIENCSVENSTIIGYRDVGGILGCANGSGIVLKGNTVTNVTMLRDKDVNYNNITTNEGHNFGAIVGRNNKGIAVDESNTYSNVTIGDLKGVSTADALKNALAEAQDGDTIYFAADIVAEEPIEIDQPDKAKISLVIDGNGFKFDGQFKIKGNSTNVHDESLVIRNINFETSTASREFIWCNDSSNGSYWRYAHNITIENCSFTAVEGSAAVHTAVGAKFQQCYNIKLVNCTAKNLHSLLQAESCGSTVTVDGCKVVNGKNGVSFNNTMNAVITNTEIEAVGSGSYGVRHKGEVNGYALTVENCNVKAFVPVLVRDLKATGYTATFKGTNTLTVNGSNAYQIALSNTDYDGTQALVKPTGTYTLTGADSFNVYKG